MAVASAPDPGQQTVKRGFRFLKDPLFFVSSVFVKKPQRVEALALIMALTLMVYTLAERKLRQALEDQNQMVRDQRKQPTAKPTLRWIMQKFQGMVPGATGPQRRSSAPRQSPL